MNDAHPCGLSAHETCSPPAALVLDEVLRRFAQEAVRGVCATGRYRCPYYTWGSGPPLLFIHGLADDSQSFAMPIAVLSRHFRCIGYDLPTGRGDGARLNRYRHEDLVVDALALLDHLGIRQSYVFGASFSATITLAALRAAPERLPRAVLQGGFARRPLAPAELLLARLARHGPGPLRWLPLRRAVLRHSHYPPFAARDRGVWEFYLRQIGQAPIAAVAQRALLLHRLDLRPILPEIRQPILMICGDDDPLVNKQCEEELLRGLPHAVRIELSQCGHLPAFTHPELLAEVVRSFLTPPPCHASSKDNARPR